MSLNGRVVWRAKVWDTLSMREVGVRAWIPAVSAAAVERPDRFVWVWIFVGLVLRATLALTTVGTNDVLSWHHFMETIAASDWVRVYRLIPVDYNHPPLMSLYLMLIHPWVGSVPNGFSFLIRLPAILADVGTALVMVRLCQRYFSAELAAAAAAVASLSPLLVLVSGFHGNTDPVFVFLFLLAAERTLIGGWRFGAGLILGLSLGIKIVPVLLFPLFFFWLPSWKERFQFFAGAAASFLAVFGYHFIADFEGIFRNVFSYDSTHGVWGYTQFLAPLGLWPKFMRLPAKLLLAGGITFAVLRLTRGQRGAPKALLEGIGLTFLVFLVLTPGFGIQYLVWLALPGLFLEMPKPTARFHAVAGLLAFSAYNHWCHGNPLGLAGSVRWNPWELFLCFVLWLVLIDWLAKWIRSGRAEAAP